MVEIVIDQRLKAAVPALTLGVIHAQVVVVKHEPSLWNEIEQRVKEIALSLTLDGVYRLPQIEALRGAYRAIGKDPGRYRGSQEALLRRVLQGKGLYRVNNVVDINNLVSLETYHSVGAYDTRRLKPPVTFRIGLPGEMYKGIGKEMINIAELPVFADVAGPFGSPTSDSERAMITEATTEVMLIIIAFGGDDTLEERMLRAVDLLCQYASSPRASIATVTIR